MTLVAQAPVSTWCAITLLGLAIVTLLASDIPLYAGNPQSAPDAHPALFTVTGTTEQPLSPGVTMPLNLTLTNSNTVDLEFTGLHITLDSVDAPRATAALPCSVRDFEVKQLDVTPMLTVPAQSAHTLNELGVAVEILPQLGMQNPNLNQDGCKGATLTLTYEYSGSSK